MKGVSPEVIVFLVIAIIIGVVVILFFTGKLSPGQKTISESDCRSNYENACSTYKSTGDMWALEQFPESCVRLLKLNHDKYKTCKDKFKTDDVRYEACSIFCKADYQDS
jgi:hypothetical protein